MSGFDPYALGPEDSVHLWGDEEYEQAVSDSDYEPDQCGQCGALMPCSDHSLSSWPTTTYRGWRVWTPTLGHQVLPSPSLCPEADLRSKMSNAEFWEHVYAPSPQDEESREWYRSSFGDNIDPGERSVDQPCSVCTTASGPCGYDADGLPYIHVESGGEK